MSAVSVNLTSDDKPYVTMLICKDGDRFLQVGIGGLHINFVGFNQECFEQARGFAMAILQGLVNVGGGLPAAPVKQQPWAESITDGSQDDGLAVFAPEVRDEETWF